MKKSLNNFSIVILLSFLRLNSLSGQDPVKSDDQKLIRLINESKVQEIILQVKDSVNSLMIVVNSNIQAGDVTIEIYDPNGEKHGYFSIGCESNTTITIKNINSTGKSVYSTNPSRASGNISRNINNPVKGEWKVKIIPQNATGDVNIAFARKLPGHIYIKIK
jgi:hypothetical protein